MGVRSPTHLSAIKTRAMPFPDECAASAAQKRGRMRGGGGVLPLLIYFGLREIRMPGTMGLYHTLPKASAIASVEK